MSEHPPEEVKPEFFDYKHVGGRFLGLIAFAVISFAVLGVGAVLEPKQFAFSYLFGYFFFFTICMGGLFWVLVHHAVDAEWSVVVRRQLENMASLLLVMAVLFIPFIFIAPDLWYWMKKSPGDDFLLDEKWPYLTKGFFWARAGFYFIFFVVCATLLRTFSIAQDKNGAARYTIFNRRVTFSSGLLFAVCLTFAGIDWLMALDYHWFSTMWGVYIFSGTALSSMCVLVLIITALRGAGYFQGVISMEHYHIMGKLMLAFTIFWAYISFSQYMLIWYSNIPEETIYFLRRNTGSWWYLQILLVVGHFVLPFLLLLPNAGKKSPAFLCGMALWILFMHAIDLYQVVLPALHKNGMQPSYLDLFALLAIGCTLAAVFLKRLGESSIFPSKDPRLPQSIALKN